MNLHKWKASIASSGIAATLSVLTLSCSNESASEKEARWKHGKEIYFGVEHSEKATKQAHSEDNGKTLAGRDFVLRAADSADALCVSTVVTRNDGNKPITRGAPVATDNFYNNFHVLAYWKKDGTLVDSQFYMDADVTSDGNNLWSTATAYFWPGERHTLQFRAWAPADAPLKAVPQDPHSTTLGYTVPNKAEEQKDIVVATTGEIRGNSNSTVPLSFNHICTAVKFVAGRLMQPGTIKSVALKGVRGSGTYDMATGDWTLDQTTTADYSQELNKAMSGSETAGSEITSTEGTFMMLPQTLPAEARVEVVAVDQAGNERTLSAPIAGAKWEMGTTVAYNISITPDYKLEFTTTPPAQDAHYVVCPITIKAENVPEKWWTLTSNDPDNVTFVEKFSNNPEENNGLKSLVDQGYWLKDHCGESTLTSSTSGDVKVYMFVKENVSTRDRHITLRLAPNYNSSSTTPRTFDFTQYCPAWNGNIGVERLQEKDYPWGFNWDESMKVTYDMPSGTYGAFLHILFLLFGDYSYLNESGLAIWGNWKVTVDFSRVPRLNRAVSSTDGQTNTWDTYNFDGVNDASYIMRELESWGGRAERELPTNPSEYAAWACAKKNRYGVARRRNGGNTVYVPTLSKEDMVWYLPSRDEATRMRDNLYPLSGDYWTSTAINSPGTTAYKYSAGGSTSAENRNSLLHVRAVRKRAN